MWPNPKNRLLKVMFFFGFSSSQTHGPSWFLWLFSGRPWKKIYNPWKKIKLSLSTNPWKKNTTLEKQFKHSNCFFLEHAVFFFVVLFVELVFPCFISFLFICFFLSSLSSILLYVVSLFNRVSYDIFQFSFICVFLFIVTELIGLYGFFMFLIFCCFSCLLVL